VFDLANEILQTMRHNKLRTTLTGLSVAWGIFMLITLVSVANGITRSFKEEMMNSDSQKISIWGGTTTKPYHGYREGRNIDLKNKDIDILSHEQRDVVQEVTSELNGTQSGISTNTTNVQAGFTGVFPSALGLNNLELIDGRFISQGDIDKKAKVMVLPKEYAEQLFPPDGKKAVGQRVECAGLSFLVIGVYESHRRTIYIPYSTARVFSSDNTNLDQIILLLNGVTEIEQADNIEKDVRHTLASAHDFDPDDESGVWIWNAVSQALTVQGAIGILNIGVWVLGLLTLLSGIIGISNIMFVSVKERTHEIGIRRAIGAKPVKILTQILTESVVITTLFGYIGIVMGTALTEVLASTVGQGMFDYAHVDLRIAIQVTVVLIVAGALAGLFPALKALKVKPVEALRDE
jgi:putative ABC transport system permease protein